MLHSLRVSHCFEAPRSRRDTSCSPAQWYPRQHSLNLHTELPLGPLGVGLKVWSRGLLLGLESFCTASNIAGSTSGMFLGSRCIGGFRASKCTTSSMYSRITRGGFKLGPAASSLSPLWQQCLDHWKGLLAGQVEAKPQTTMP